MDVLGMRIPEYHDTARASRVPLGCATEKTSYIKDRQDIIKNMEIKIAEQKEIMNQIADKQCESYQNAVKRLKKCYEIKQNCEASIALTEKQLEIERNSSIKIR